MQGTAELDKMGAGLLEQLQRMEVRSSHSGARTAHTDKARRDKSVVATHPRRLALIQASKLCVRDDGLGFHT